VGAKKSKKAKRHHFLPQFLLRGFASRTAGEDTFAWLFRRGQEAVETTLQNIAIEKHFHGKDGGDVGGLEQKMQVVEGDSAALLREIENQPIDAQHIDRIAVFVANLTIRTKHVRDSFASSAEVILRKIGEGMDQTEYWNSLMNDVERQAFEKFAPVARHFGLSSTQAATFLRNSRQSGEFQARMKAVRTVFINGIDVHGGSAAGHIKALKQSQAPSERVRELSQLHWKVSTFAPDSLVLGDVGVLALDNQERFHAAIGRTKLPLTAVLLPISSTALLVGSVGDERSYDAEKINRVSVELSRDFFVSSTNSAREQQYAVGLGAKSELLTNEEMDAIVADIMRERTS